MLVLAGLNIVTPASVILSITVSVTPEDAAPMMASTFSAIRRSDVTLAMSVVVSPESPWVYSTGAPSTPPAALISSMAYARPANSGGPRKARLPVSGSNEPIFKHAVAGTLDADRNLVDDHRVGRLRLHELVRLSSMRLSAPNSSTA